MAVLHVRSFPDQLYDALKKRAQGQGRSLSAEVIVLLHEAVETPARTQNDILAGIAQRRRFNPTQAGAPSSTELIREDREN